MRVVSPAHATCVCGSYSSIDEVVAGIRWGRFAAVANGDSEVRVTVSDATVVVVRPSGRYRDSLRPYKIVIDGQLADRIMAGGEVDLRVAPGAHSIRASIDWTGSEQVEFDAVAGEQVRFDIRPAGSPLVGILQVFGRHRYLRLSRIDTA
jgi:hypothetical protein